MLLPVLFVAILAVLGLSGFFGAKANAATKFPAGDMRILQAPEIEHVSVIDGEDEEFEYNVLRNSAVDTGEHYKYLSEDEKIIYRALYTIVKNKKYIPYATNTYGVPASDFSEYAYTLHEGSSSMMDESFNSELNIAKQALYFDHPGNVEYYMCWPEYLYSRTHYSVTGSISKYEDIIIVKANYDDTQFASLDNQISASLNTWKNELATEGLISSWKAITEMKIHDYYAAQLTYDHDCADDNTDTGYFNVSHTAYGALCGENKCVCDGYSSGFMMIMNNLANPVNTMVISGYGGGGGHAWNIVKLDGRWYELDTTWASTAGNNATWFNKTTSQFTGLEHIRVTNGYSGFRMPKAYGTHYTRSYIESHNESNMEHDTYVELTGISISPTSKSMITGEQVAFSVSFTPANASTKDYYVSSSDNNVATISGNYIVAIGPGDAVITVESEENRLEATCVVTVQAPVKDTGSKIANSNKSIYIVTSKDEQTVSYSGTANKNETSCNIPDSITDENGVEYSVTAVADNAYKGGKKLKKVTIPATVKVIGKNAFKNCKNLKTININATSLTKVKSGAFKGIKANAKITISAPSKKVYNKVVKMFKKAGAKTQKYKFKKTK